MLLALLDDGESAVRQILSDSGADLEELSGLLTRGNDAGEA